jgi:hypothetical protein
MEIESPNFSEIGIGGALDSAASELQSTNGANTQSGMQMILGATWQCYLVDEEFVYATMYAIRTEVVG